VAACGRWEAPGDDSGTAVRTGGDSVADRGASGLAPVVRLTPETADPIRAEEPLFGRCRLDLDRRLGDRNDFGYVGRIRRLDDELLLVLDQLASPFFKLLDTKTGSVRQRLGERGGGPGEFSGPSAMFVTTDEPPQVGLYDYPNRRIELAELDRRAGRLERVGAIPLVGSLPILNLAPSGTTTLIGSGRFVDFTLARVDSTGRTLEKLVTDPPFDAEDLGGSATFAGLMNSARMAVAGRRRVAVAYRSVTALDLVDLEFRSHRRVVGPGTARADPVIRSGRLFVDEEHSRMAYHSVAVTEELVFAAFNGLTEVERRRAKGPTTVHLRVFDWEGRFLAELELEHGVSSIEVSADGRRLWAGIEDPYPRVGEWPLPPLAQLTPGETVAETEACSGPAGRAN